MILRNLKIHGATLLSVEEAENLLTEEERRYREWWWLRSPGNYSNFAAGVNYDGDAYYYGEQYVDYDWQDFILAEDELNLLKKLII